MRSNSFAASFLAASLALLALPGAARAEEPPPPSPAQATPMIGRDCDDSTPLPPTLHCARRYRGLFVGGGVTAGVGDVIAVVTIAGNGAKDPVAFIPVAGPLIAAATHQRPPPPSCGAGVWFCGGWGPWDLSVPGYIAAGALQAVGLALLVGGAAARGSHVESGPPVALVPVPMVGPAGSGLGLVGTF
jgi:hypothetical protein